MKKIFTYTLVFAVVFALSGVVALAAPISTGLVRDTSGGAEPIVKVKWEAYVDRYSDELPGPGAQFAASGVYNGHLTIALCAIVTDPDGLADIDNVYGDVFYPTGIALGDHHVPLADQSGLGCGALMQEDTLSRLSKQDGIDLFCGDVRTLNENLPMFDPAYDYDEICAQDGELMKETAAVYCGEKQISYEDPSGIYEVWAVAQDKNGLQDTLVNQFEYLETTAFETDFSQVAYGNVKLNTHKIINGDLTWDAMDTGLASVRNVGNTRLQMAVVQDDMGLGMTDGLYNVEYDARVGSNAPFAIYPPNNPPTPLLDLLDLSELDEMDFSILIKKFPPTNPGPGYTGTMTLSATMQPHLVCEAI